MRRIEQLGVQFIHPCKIGAETFAALCEANDAVIVATGGHAAKVFHWKGKERVVKGFDYLKAINRGEHSATGKRVVIIGCGNFGMDAATGAYQMGAQIVLALTCRNRLPLQRK